MLKAELGCCLMVDFSVIFNLSLMIPLMPKVQSALPSAQSDCVRWLWIKRSPPPMFNSFDLQQDKAKRLQTLQWLQKRKWKFDREV